MHYRNLWRAPDRMCLSSVVALSLSNHCGLWDHPVSSWTLIFRELEFLTLPCVDTGPAVGGIVALMPRSSVTAVQLQLCKSVNTWWACASKTTIAKLGNQIARPWLGYSLLTFVNTMACLEIIFLDIKNKIQPWPGSSVD